MSLAAASVYVGAASTPPNIVCPDWCHIHLDEHLADLANWDGRVVHKWFSVPTINSEVTPALERFDLSLGVSTLVDGTSDPEDPHGFGVLIEGREYTVAEVEAIARELAEVVRIGHEWEANHR